MARAERRGSGPKAACLQRRLFQRRRKALQGDGSILRLRVGDYRVLYTVTAKELIVAVVTWGVPRGVPVAAASAASHRPALLVVTPQSTYGT